MTATKPKSLARSGSLSSLCVMYGAAIAFGTTLVVSNGIGPAGAGEFFRLMALFAIATSTAVFGADTGLVRTISAQNALGRYSAIPRLIRYAVLPPLALSLGIIAFFVRRQFALETPLLNLRVFAYPQFRYAVLILVCAYFLFMGLEILMPMYTQQVLLLTGTATGLILMPASIA